MSASVTARDMARASLTKAIKDAARLRVASDGAARLSVRAVARDVGMVSSAVYRYFPTRDHLLTALIVEAYDSLGLAVESADAAAPPDDVRARWRSACRAVRSWARDSPQEYALIFGSPIPGYRAPQDTVAPAARVPTAVLALVAHGWSIDAVTESDGGALPELLRTQTGGIANELALDLPDSIVLRAAIAWTQLFGMVTFELFGQFVGSFDPADEFFDATAELMADFVGISRS